ncbi:hypothetical protein BH10PSE7_BH10PSE7_32870 [soil metagenome]
MPNRLEKSLKILTKNAKDFSELAHGLQESSEKLHVVASKEFANAEALKEVSNALTRDVAEIRADTVPHP